MGPAAAADASAAKAKAMFSDSDSGSSGDSRDSGSSGDSSSSDSGASGASQSASASGDSRSRSDRAARGRRSRETTKRPKNVVGGDDASDHALTINAAFARRYEHNMRRAETQRLKEKVKREYIIRPPGSGGSDDDSDGSDDSSSSSESDEGDVPEKLRKQFAEALVKIKNKDPSLYRPDARLFDEDEEDDEDDEEAKKNSKKKKPKKQTLREVTAAQLLEGGATAFEEEEERRPNERGRGPKNPADAKSYVEEQADLKRAFLDAQKSDSDDDSSSGSSSDSDAGGLRVKRRAETPAEEDDDARKKALGEYFGDAPIGANEEGSAPRDDGGGIRGGDEKSPATTRLSKEDAFLRDYLMNEKWREAEGDGALGSDDDSDAFEEAERFEQTYNFRFEEPDGGAIRSHARSIEGTIRKASTARKDARRAKKERKMSEKERMRAEVRRLKNLKREEIRAKMAQIARVGGLAGADAVAKAQSLTAEFDPDAHDAAMRMMYDDAYYDGALLGEDGEALEAKPEFGDLDEEVRGLLGAQGATSGGGAENGGDDLNNLEGDEDADEGGGAAEESEAFRRVRDALQKKKEGDDFDGDDVDDSDSDGDGIPIPPEGGSGTDARAGTDASDENNKFSKRAAKRWKKELLAKMDEYYRLDAEDFIDDVPCRFKYKEVAPSMYGLTTREILAMSDKDLTQIVPLKKLAPYRRDADEGASAREKARSQRMAREFLKRDAERRREKERRGGRKGKNKRAPDEEGDKGDEGEDAAERESALEKAAEARKASYGAKAWGKHNVDENGRAIKKKKENAREGGDAGDAKGAGEAAAKNAAGGAAPKPRAPSRGPGRGKTRRRTSRSARSGTNSSAPRRPGCCSRVPLFRVCEYERERRRRRRRRRKKTTS